MSELFIHWVVLPTVAIMYFISWFIHGVKEAFYMFSVIVGCLQLYMTIVGRLNPVHFLMNLAVLYLFCYLLVMVGSFHKLIKEN